MSFSDVELAIIFTLAYTDQFSYPLTKTELWLRLIRLTANSKTSLTASRFERALKQLLRQNIVEIWQGYYLLAGLKSPELRTHRAEIANRKSREVQQLQQLLAFFPGITAVFVTGSAAMDNAELDDDLDLCLVTAPNRLWINRLMLVALSRILGKKKKRNQAGKHGWCFNLWLDENHLQMPLKNRMLYQAYEVIQVRPIWGEADKIQRFFTENSWVTTFLPNFSHQSLSEAVSPSSFRTEGWSKWLMNQLDFLAYHLQLVYMKRHRTTEKVGVGFAFFHPRPTAQLIQLGWMQAIRRQKKHPELATIAATYVERFFAKETEKSERKR